MSIRRRFLAIFAVMFAGIFSSSANADIIINEFTGDDIQMQFVISDNVDGSVDIAVSFTGASAETGDITGVWLGYVDSLFLGTITTGDVTVTASTETADGWTSIVPVTIDLGGGVTLEGGAGIYDDFDLDIGVRQDDASGGNEIVSSLTIHIADVGLTASMFNEAGARVQSSTGEVDSNGDPDGSSKLIGGRITHEMPEPGTLGLLSLGLIGAGLIRRRRVSAEQS